MEATRSLRRRQAAIVIDRYQHSGYRSWFWIDI